MSPREHKGLKLPQICGTLDQAFQSSLFVPGGCKIVNNGKLVVASHKDAYIVLAFDISFKETRWDQSLKLWPNVPLQQKISCFNQ